MLAVARASVPDGISAPQNAARFFFEFLGLVGIADPLRPTVPAAVRECRSAGVRVTMITGDDPQTARGDRHPGKSRSRRYCHRRRPRSEE